MLVYDHKKIEAKWQEKWEKENTFAAVPHDQDEKNIYLLETFPYPSGAGLHVGHPEGYTAEDIQARYYRMNGKQVLYTMGWDAFGLPTENYAIKVGKNPKVVAAENIANFKRQVKMFGFSYDWDREINTSDPSYYKWTQWLFLQLYKHGLAYFAEAPVNWCPKDNTVLANEQVVDGKCERCGAVVEQRMMAQWFLKITGEDPTGKNGSYPERLLNGVADLDWPNATKFRQREWIGKSEGATVRFSLVGVPGQQDGQHSVDIFTTRLDTIFGATFLVISPELAKKWVSIGWQASPQVQEYLARALTGKELDRLEQAAREKTGVDSGLRAINPATEKEIPVWIADYVLGSYGTGAIMAVPAHDERDFAFAKRFDLPIVQVVAPTSIEHSRDLFYPASPVVAKDGESVAEATSRVNRENAEGLLAAERCYLGEGVLTNSNAFDGMTSALAREAIAQKIGAQKKIQYRLRDWLVSRQRYWGAPIPMIHCPTCGWVPVPEEQLPVILPDDIDFAPTGEPPLASSESFMKTHCPTCGGEAKRSAETLDTFVDSSWYFFRYCDSMNETAFAESKKIAQWMPIDLYIIGAEHTVLHLLYSRFITKALHDMGYVSFDEPFQKLRHVGLIMGKDGHKMSKSRGNVVNPDEVVATYGADSFRLFEMFLGPLEDAKPWNTDSIAGVRRFLERVWHITLEPTTQKPAPSPATSEQEQELKFLTAKTVRKVTEDIQNLSYNTSVSAMMELVNHLFALRSVETPAKKDTLRSLILILQPFAPHVTAELWEKMFPEEQPVWQQSWPVVSEADLQQDTVTVVVQVNGKLRGNIVVAVDASESALVAAAAAETNVAKWLAGKKVIKTVVKLGKLVNFVVEQRD